MLKEFVLKAFVLSLLLLTGSSVFGQGTIRGTVRNTDSGEPAIFVNVYLKGTNHGVQTDLQGFYALTKIPAGSYTLIVSSVEFEETRREVEVKNGRITSHDFSMKLATVQLAGAEISAGSSDQKTQARVSVNTIRPQDIKRIPSFGGQADLVQVLQVLPGFVSTGDQGGQLYIRGGSPVQNKVLLDGMVVYNAFHSIGLFSVFDTDIISNADVYTGGFGAEFDGNKKRIGGNVGLSPFGAKIMLEGPLKKLKDGQGSVSYVLSAKTSYLEESSKLIYKYIDEDGLPFNYTDLYGKVTLASRTGSKVSFFGFNFSDQVRYQALSNLNWKNTGGGAKSSSYQWKFLDFEISDQP
jgi:hypothetical protein